MIEGELASTNVSYIIVDLGIRTLDLTKEKMYLLMHREMKIYETFFAQNYSERILCAQILQKEAEWPDGYILFSIFVHW